MPFFLQMVDLSLGLTEQTPRGGERTISERDSRREPEQAPYPPPAVLSLLLQSKGQNQRKVKKPALLSSASDTR